MKTLTTIVEIIQSIDIMSLIELLFGGTGIYFGIKYRRENKKLKQNEVSQSNTKTQEEQIDLGIKFIKSSQEAVEMIQKTTLNIEDRLKEMDKRVDDRIVALDKKVDMKMTNMRRSMSGYNKQLKLVIKFLDGPFTEFLKMEDEAKKGGKNDNEAAN